MSIVDLIVLVLAIVSSFVLTIVSIKALGYCYGIGLQMKFWVKFWVFALVVFSLIDIGLLVLLLLLLEGII